MDDLITVKQYIATKKVTRVFAVVLTVLAVACLLGGILSGRIIDSRDAEEFFPAYSESGTTAYLDIVGLSDWIYQYGDDVYYCAEDAEGYLYTLCMEKSTVLGLGNLRDYWDRESDAVAQPQPYRVYGKVVTLPSRVKQNMATWWEVSQDEYVDYFGPTLLDTTRSSGAQVGSFLYVGALIFGLLAAALLIDWIGTAAKTKKSLARLEALGLSERAEQELNSAATIRIGSDSARLGDTVLFGARTGIAAAYGDILWCFARINKRNGVVVSTTLVVNTREKKNVTVASVSGKDEANVIGQAIAYIAARNPNGLFGYTTENAKAYKTRRKGGDTASL